MDPRLEKVIDKMKKAHLTSAEKAEVLSRTFSVIEKIEAVSLASHHTHSSKVIKRNVKSPFVDQWFVYFRQTSFVSAFALAVVLLLTGSLSLAAEGALPGDSLYSLKINVNEGLKELTAVTPEAKARLAVEATERRLQEAATLSASGKLTEGNKDILNKEFTKQATQIKNQVASLVAQNKLSAAQEVAINFESSLKAHEIILEKLSAEEASSPAELHTLSFLSLIKDQLATTTFARADLQNKEVQDGIGNKEIAEDRLKETNLKLKDLIETRKLDVSTFALFSTSTGSIVNESLSLATTSIQKAKDYIDEGKYTEAVIVLQLANRSISDIDSLVGAETLTTDTVKQALGILPGGVGTVGAAAITAASLATSTATSTDSVATSTASTTPSDVATSTASTTPAN